MAVYKGAPGTFYNGCMEAVVFTLDEELVPHRLSATLAKTIADDCLRFEEEHAAILNEACERDDYGEWQAGVDFWLTRNGHGAGFWDRGLGDVGNELTEAARASGARDAYLGDDGEVHLS